VEGVMLLNPTSGMTSRSRTVWPPRQSTGTLPTVAGMPLRRRLPGWILIGSTGRKSGKTEFACAIIRAFHWQCSLVAVKVTAITEGESTCPRGRESCGVCSTLKGDVQISEERGEHPGKDTARMLGSGASRVFWLRCKKRRMHAALEALAPRLGQGALVVAESNSLAQVIEPDLFLMVKNGHSSFVKPTAAEVMPLVDRVVVSVDGRRDLNPSQLAVVGGVWRLAEASAAICRGTAG
jgi:hypothetical protein